MVEPISLDGTRRDSSPDHRSKTRLSKGAGSLRVGVPNIAARWHQSDQRHHPRGHGHAIWLAGDYVPGVTHIDPATNTVTGVRNARGNAAALALERDSVLAVCVETFVASFQEIKATQITERYLNSAAGPSKVETNS